MVMFIMSLYILLFIYLIFIVEKEDFNNNKILVSKIETTVEMIDKKNFNNYKKNLDNLYQTCEFSDGIHSNFNLNNPESLVFVLINNNYNNIIGSLQIDDFDKLNKDFYINSLKAIPNKKGLYLTYLCGDSNYKGITEPLFQAVEEYAKTNNFEYILLEAKGEWRKNYYKKFGYKNVVDDNFQSMIKVIN